MEYYASPRWSGEVSDCSMPMTFDTYSNCSFGCLYCFSQFQRGVGNGKDKYLAKSVKHVNVERVKRIFTEPGYSQFWPYIEQRKVIQWGGLSDQFDYFEKKQGKTLELLRFFRSIDYPICFSTKSTWWVDDPRYKELFQGNKNWNVKFSIITLDADKARLMEPGVPTPQRRLRALGKYAALDAGGATLRLRPFIIGLSNPSHTELIRLAGEAGATAMSTEFFCVEQRSPVLKAHLDTFNKLCGFDVMAFYRKFSSGAGYLRLNRNVKRKFVDEMEGAAKKAGIRFYVSDAHFKERCHNGSCCGLPEGWNYSKGQFCEALMLCKKNGSVTWDEIASGCDSFLNFNWHKAEGFNCTSAEKRALFYRHTMFDYLRWLWNNPTAGQSPYKMYEGVMKPSGKDANGNLIYTYDETRA